MAIPRDAQEQLAAARAGSRRARRERRGEAIDPSRLRRGELLFFGPEPEAATHVALYGGNGEFLHAYGQVCLGSLNPKSQHYVNTLVKSFLGATPWSAFMPSVPGRSE
jgi:cell wall-associated NlpC family hydrolase